MFVSSFSFKCCSFQLIIKINRSFTSLVKFIPKYCIVFDTLVNWIVFFIYFSDILLLVYRNANDFYMLVLYAAA